MKITKRQLRRIVKEEKQKLVKEAYQNTTNPAYIDALAEIIEASSGTFDKLDNAMMHIGPLDKELYPSIEIALTSLENVITAAQNALEVADMQSKGY